MEHMMRNGAHICVDMQKMFSHGSEWHAPWMDRVLPAVSELAGRFADRTIFTRFVPAQSPDTAPGAWQRVYARWPGMTLDRLRPEMVELVPELARYVPPAAVLDKQTYSPWYDGRLHPDQALTREQMIRFYTINNAWLMRAEDEIGSLEPGKRADFIIVDRDLLNCPDDDIRDTRVLATYLDGNPLPIDE